MPFVVHTEKLNLIPSVVEEVNDEIHHHTTAAVVAVKKRQQPPQIRSVIDTGSATTTKNRVLPNRRSCCNDHQYIDNSSCATDNTPVTQANSKSLSQTHHTPSEEEIDHHHHENRNNNPHSDVTSFQSRYYEMKALFHLTIPTLIIQLGQVIPGFTIASYIGRNYSYDISYLDGYTLASLTINLFTLSLLLGLYTATDTLSPQAYGAGNFKEVGYLAIRGYVASMIIVVPIILVLVYNMKSMLLWFGEDTMSVIHACTWFNIYAYSIPFYALYQVTLKFLSSQNQMRPLVICCIISTCCILPLSLYTFTTLYDGYIGTAIAMSIYQCFQAMFLILYIYIYQPHDPTTWSGLYDGILNALQYQPLITYMSLGIGGVLAMSEWIYWEALALLIGTFGIVPLSVHTIPAQILMITFMGPYSLGIALSIRLGATIPVLVSRAQQTTIDCFVVSVTFFGLLSILMYIQQDWLVSLFTTSDAVIQGCHDIWWDVCLYSFVLSIYGIHMGACVGLGMQWTLGTATIISLWIFGLPSTYYLAVVRGGGIQMAWSLIWPPYILLPIVLTIAIVRADWEEIAHDIRKREGIELMDHGRPSFLLSPISNRTNTTNATTQQKQQQQQPLLLSSQIVDPMYGSTII